MSSTKTLTEQIKKLQERIKVVETKQAVTFVRNLRKIVSDDTDLEIVIGLVASQWSQASSKQKEEWHHKGAKFCGKRSSRSRASASAK